MKSKKWISLLVAATMVTGLVGLAGCNKKTEPKNPDTKPVEETTGKKDADQHLKLILLEPQTLDPNEAQDTSTHVVLSAVQESLVRVKVVDGKDKIEPAGAESWEVSPDGLTWTFKLRDYKWSDGVKVTAKNYVDSYLRLLNKEKAFPYAYFLYDIKGAQAYNEGNGKIEDVGVAAKDDSTLVITLEQPTPYFEKKLVHTAMFPIRLDVIEKGGENWSTDITKQVYSGPYKIKEWIRDNKLVFEKNQDYWDAKNVTIEKVEMNDIKEFSTQAQLFESKQLDVTGSRQEYIKKWTEAAKTGKFQAAVGEVPGAWYLGFNMNGGPSGLMANQKIRLAMALSVDRQEYVDVITGRYTPAYGWVPKAIEAGDVNFREKVKEPLKGLADEYLNKPEKLQALFKEGLKELGKDTSDLSKIKLKYVTTGATASAKQQQEWYQQQFLKNLGINIEVQVLGDFGIWMKAIDNMEYDFMMWGWSADFNDPINFLEMFQSKGGNNSVKLNNAEYDKILAELPNETDQNKRIEKYQRLEEILVKEEVAITPMYYEDTRRFTQNYVKDFMTPKFGPSYEWRWAYTEGR